MDTLELPLPNVDGLSLDQQEWVAQVDQSLYTTYHRLCHQATTKELQDKIAADLLWLRHWAIEEVKAHQPLQ